MTVEASRLIYNLTLEKAKLKTAVRQLNSVRKYFLAEQTEMSEPIYFKTQFNGFYKMQASADRQKLTRYQKEKI